MPKTSDAAPALSAVILAGGESRRLGQKKADLVLGQQTLLARSVSALATLSDDVIVVTRVPRKLKGPARVTSDILAGHGALSGLHAGLSAARQAYALVVACDMPFLNLRLLRYMAVIAPGYDAIVPHWQGEAEPLHAIYARTCLPAIEELLESPSPRKRIVDFYPQLTLRYLERDEIALFDPQGLSFFNVNTPEDWQRAQDIEAVHPKVDSE